MSPCMPRKQNWESTGRFRSALMDIDKDCPFQASDSQLICFVCYKWHNHGLPASLNWFGVAFGRDERKRLCFQTDMWSYRQFHACCCILHYWNGLFLSRFPLFGSSFCFLFICKFEWTESFLVFHCSLCWVSHLLFAVFEVGRNVVDRNDKCCSRLQILLGVPPHPSWKLHSMLSIFSRSVLELASSISQMLRSIVFIASIFAFIYDQEEALCRFLFSLRFNADFAWCEDCWFPG